MKLKIKSDGFFRNLVIPVALLIIVIFTITKFSKGLVIGSNLPNETTVEESIQPLIHPTPEVVDQTTTVETTTFVEETATVAVSKTTTEVTTIPKTTVKTTVVHATKAQTAETTAVPTTKAQTVETTAVPTTEAPVVETTVSPTTEPALKAAAPSDTEASDSGNEHGEFYDMFTLTAYCPCYTCSEGWGKQTSSGAWCTEGRTVACNSIPFGTHIYIEGYGEYVVEDTGGGLGSRTIDIFFDYHREDFKDYRAVYILD